MSVAIEIIRAGPLVTVQDEGRMGALRHGISASGPMDRGGFAAAGAALDGAGTAGLEFTRAGVDFTVTGPVKASFAGGMFSLAVNGAPHAWPAVISLRTGDRVSVTPGPAGNYGYVRFSAEIDVPPLLGSRATNTIVGLGGLEGRALVAGDRLSLSPASSAGPSVPFGARQQTDGTLRFVWGVHADLFDPAVREAFCAAEFSVTQRLDRMGVRLASPADIFRGMDILSLVSDAVVPGDVQILGDGTPIVLMRDHQPTGGYPRIATIISADLDRFAQMRPGAGVRFLPVSVAHAQALSGAR